MKSIKGQNGDILIEPGGKAKRWRKYFIELLNANAPSNPIRSEEYKTEEPMINDMTSEETKRPITNLKKLEGT